MQQPRPSGITTLAILGFMGGVLVILAGIGSVVLIRSLIVSLILLLIGITIIVQSYGLWTLKKWAWILDIAVQITTIVVGVVSAVSGHSADNTVLMVISAAILYYLMRPHVRQAFARA